MQSTNPTLTLDATIAQAWQTHLSDAEATPRLARPVHQEDRALFERFAHAYRDLLSLSRQRRRWLLRKTGRTLAGAALAFALFGSANVQAATITVDGTCSLADAISSANTDTAVGGCPAGSGADTLNLTGDVTLSSGLPVVATTITIEGDGFTVARDSSAPNFRIFEVKSSGDLTLNETTVSGGSEPGSYGGGISNGGRLTLTNSTVSGNTAGDYGGGICHFGTMLTMTQSTVSGNTAGGNGGGIENYDGSATTIINSTISGNTAGGNGGGIENYFYARLRLKRTVISGNSAPRGAEVSRRTGVINADANNLFGDSSLTNAEAFDGFTPGGSDITATSDGTTPTALRSILDPTLSHNGGDTKTHALVAGSPAIDMAGPDCPARDQRGISRPQGADCDIGAFELEVEVDLEQAALDLAETIETLDLSLFNGPNDKANTGRRGSLAKRAIGAARAIAAGDIKRAIKSLDSLLDKIDGQSPPPDWMDASPEQADLADDVEELIAQLELEL